jgi:general L-amino acid transport system substrate-binding protein
MLAAEELGISSANVAELLATSKDPKVRRLLGLEGIKGEGLKLADNWAVKIVSQVGNYAEVFSRNVGSGSPLQIERGLNALWTDGGIQYAPPSG